MNRVQCEKCDKLVTIPAYNDFKQFIFVAVSTEPIMHRQIPLCKSCFHQWNELMVITGRKFVGAAKLDPIHCKRKIPKLNEILPINST